MYKAIWKIQSNPLLNLPRRLSFSFRSLVAREPALWLLYQPYLWWGQMKRKAAGQELRDGLLLPDTELVIDGFQGSANSFATTAFKRNQTRQVKLMHHRHAPVLIIRATEQGIPVLLTIREPVGTVLSVASRWPHISASQVLQSYTEFYTKLEPYASHYVISTFELTTHHLDRVVQTVNEKFNTNFDLVNVAQANAKFQARARDPKREAVKQQKKKELAALPTAHLLAQANAVYQRYETLAQQTVKL